MVATSLLVHFHTSPVQQFEIRYTVEFMWFCLKRYKVCVLQGNIIYVYAFFGLLFGFHKAMCMFIHTYLCTHTYTQRLNTRKRKTRAYTLQVICAVIYCRKLSTLLCASLNTDLTSCACAFQILRSSPDCYHLVYTLDLF